MRISKPQEAKPQYIRWFKDISIGDVTLVGGKNASLGEMYQHLTKKGIHVPNGFAVTAEAYWLFLKETGLDKMIKEELKRLDITNVESLQETGKRIRTAIIKAILPESLRLAIVEAYGNIPGGGKKKNASVAVRSSATAEDLPEASFAGQQETYLNISGADDVVASVQKCIASLFTDRAISYREQRGFDHLSIALSVTVQQMVHADTGASGVMFTLDTESGFTGVTLVTASYGLGEYVVKGRVTPDQYYVFKEGINQGKSAVISRTLGKKDVKLVYGARGGTKQARVPMKDQNRFVLSDEDVVQLAKWGALIEAHYGVPQDIEWAKDGKTGQLCIVQARPETVKTNSNHAHIEQYRLKKEGTVMIKGIAVGQRIGAGKVRVVESPKDMKFFKEGEVLVTQITDPDWEPIMRKAAAIVTEQGGKTSHAAIVSRELGVPCVVGAIDARKIVKNGQAVTVSCANGDEGVIYKDILPFEVKKTVIDEVPATKTLLMMNVGDPDHAFSLSFLPNDGIGLARLEFIFTNFLRIHPLALVHFNKLKDKKAKKQIEELTVGYKDKTQYAVDKLAEGIARIAVAVYPKPVIVRLSDFKTNEYATLIGGEEFEPKEENPMLGWRGASRYYSDAYKPGFKLECDAMKRVRNEWGLTNVIAMVPFCRTPEEGQKVLDTMAEFGLKRGDNGLEVYVMCEIPSNVILAEDFAKLFDGFSIGSNDLTQLTLGVDRDTTTLTDIGDANDPSVKQLIKDVIRVAHAQKKKVGICGQAPSDYPEFADFLVQQGIDSISLNPDTVVETRQRVADIEKTLGRTGKKTNKTYLSFVVGLGAVAAALITLGSGCQPVGQVQQVSPQAEVYVSPALIREKAMKKVQDAVEQKEQEHAQQMTKLKERNIAEFSVEYPSKWVVEHWQSGLKLQDEGGKEYVSIYKQLVDLPIAQEKKEKITVSGKDAFKSSVVAKDGMVMATVIEIPDEEQGTLVIEGNGEYFEKVVQSFTFSASSTLPDRGLTHWDIREGRACIQVITYARSGEGASCEPFPTPCDVPEGWNVCDAGDVE